MPRLYLGPKNDIDYFADSNKRDNYGRAVDK